MGLLTYKQAAAELGVSERTVRRMVASGELPVLRPRPSTPRIDPRSLDELLGRDAQPISSGQRGMLYGRAEVLAFVQGKATDVVVAEALAAVGAETEHVSELAARPAGEAIDWILAQIEGAGVDPRIKLSQLRGRA